MWSIVETDCGVLLLQNECERANWERREERKGEESEIEVRRGEGEEYGKRARAWRKNIEYGGYNLT